VEACIKINKAARKRGRDDKALVAVAVTDHDAVSGIIPTAQALSKALKAAELPDIEVVPGIEFTTSQGLHLLGYYIDIFDEELLGKLNRDVYDSRYSRAFVIRELFERFFKDKGLHNLIISEEELKESAPGRNLTRAHFEILVYEKLVRMQEQDQDGYVRTVPKLIQAISSAAGDKFVPVKIDPSKDLRKSDDGFGDISALIRTNLTDRDMPLYRAHAQQSLYPIKEAIQMVERLGGVAILAHPGQGGSKNRVREATIEEFVEYGLDGIEAWSSHHHPDDNRDYHKAAQRIRETRPEFIFSRGSDFHGRYSRAGQILGKVDKKPTPYAVLNLIQKKVDAGPRPGNRKLVENALAAAVSVPGPDV
jgi:predicted metal-dependent phosphoesterase TrpH